MLATAEVMAGARRADARMEAGSGREEEVL